MQYYYLGTCLSLESGSFRVIIMIWVALSGGKKSIYLKLVLGNMSFIFPKNRFILTKTSERQGQLTKTRCLRVGKVLDQRC